MFELETNQSFLSTVNRYVKILRHQNVLKIRNVWLFDIGRVPLEIFCCANTNLKTIHQTLQSNNTSQEQWVDDFKGSTTRCCFTSELATPMTPTKFTTYWGQSSATRPSTCFTADEGYRFLFSFQQVIMCIKSICKVTMYSTKNRVKYFEKKFNLGLNYVYHNPASNCEHHGHEYFADIISWLPQPFPPIISDR